MKLDVVFTPEGLSAHDLQGRPVFVIDTLRATTVMCAALAGGARGIIPTSSTEEAMKLAQNLESQDVLLCGERNAARIPGYALGNSPLEMTEDAVRGKTLIMTTTNGTRAVLAAAGGHPVYLAAAVNLQVAAARAREVLAETGDLLILCAGRASSFAIEDAYTAGRLTFAAMGERWIRKGLNDAAVASLDLVRLYGRRWDRPLGRSTAARELRAAGFEDDVTASAEEDRWPVLPQFHDRRVTLAPASQPAGPPAL